jgi:hypothetical protein
MEGIYFNGSNYATLSLRNSITLPCGFGHRLFNGYGLFNNERLTLKEGIGQSAGDEIYLPGPSTKFGQSAAYT